MTAEFIKNKLPSKTIEKEDIVAVSIETCYNYKSGSWYYYRDLFSELGYYFEDEEMIDLLFNSRDYVKKMYSNDLSKENKIETEETFGTKEDITIQEVDEKSIVDYNNRFEPTSNVSVIFKTKFGKELKTTIEILEKDMDKLVDKMEKDEKYVNIVKQKFISEGEFSIEHIWCDTNTQKQIRDEIRKRIEKMPLKEIYTSLRNTDECLIYQYYYEKNTLIDNTISITITEDLFNIVTDILNKDAVEKMKKIKNEDIYAYFYVDIPESSYEQKYIRNADFSKEVIEKFIIENSNEKVDYTQQYYILKGNIGKYGSIYFYTNKVKEIDKMIEKMETENYEFIKY